MKKEERKMREGERRSRGEETAEEEEKW